MRSGRLRSRGTGSPDRALARAQGRKRRPAWPARAICAPMARTGEEGRSRLRDRCRHADHEPHRGAAMSAGDAALAGAFAASAADDPAFAAWWTRACRMAVTPDAVRATLARRAYLDVRVHAAAVRAPTSVVHRTADAITPVEHGRWPADHVPGARLRELPGADHL